MKIFSTYIVNHTKQCYLIDNIEINYDWNENDNIEYIDGKYTKCICSARFCSVKRSLSNCIESYKKLLDISRCKCYLNDCYYCQKRFSVDNNIFIINHTKKCYLERIKETIQYKFDYFDDIEYIDTKNYKQFIFALQNKYQYINYIIF